MRDAEMSDRQRGSIEKRTLAIADQYIHDDTVALTSAMDLYTVANLVRNLDDLENDELRILSLYRMDLDLNYSHEVNNIFSRFEEVILDDCEGTHLDTVIKSVLEEAKIKRFHFFSQILDPQVDLALERGLANSNLGVLSLTVEMPRTTAEHLCVGINQSRLKELILDQCEIYVDAMGILCDCFRANQRLEVLKVEHCSLRDGEVADLVRSVKEHPQLLELSVRMNRMLDEGTEAVVELLNCTPRLQRLDCAQQNPGHLDLRQLAEALRYNATLTHLNLQENYLMDSDVPALIDTLSVNTTLRELNLENCDIKDGGLSLIVNSLSNFQGLTHLRLKENMFLQPLDQGTLLESLRRNHVLQVIDLDDEDLICPKLKLLMFLNRAGRKYIAQESLPLSSWPTLLARVKQLFEAEKDYEFKETDIIFELLQGPALLQR
jgi:hypothetical protein